MTVDTLRPDALGWIAPGKSTPVIDALASEGFRFPAAVSPAPLTQPAHASLFTGLIPRRHGVRDNGQILSDAKPVLAALLREHGYRTAAFVSGYPLASEFGLDRGFELYDDAFSSNQGTERPADETTDAAREWLNTVSGPWFLWVHYYDPHDPYTPPADYARPGSRGLYDGEVAFVDHSVGRLLGAARAAGPLLTVLTADHGESLGEHGENTHGFFIYESTMAVPLIIHFPGRLAAGSSSAPVRLLDVGPTLLELLGLPALGPELDGVSIMPLMTGRDQEIPAAYMEARRPWLSYGWAPLRAVRSGRWKLIAAPRPELFDLSRDPGESHNLVTFDRRTARRLSTLLLAVEKRASVEGAGSVSPEARKRLEALGYVAGADVGDAPAGRPDPKDKVEAWNLLSAALEHSEAGRHGKAMELFDQVLEDEPDNPFALSRSAAALAAAGEKEPAIQRFRRALELRPKDVDARVQLATLLNAVGRNADAAEQWQRVVGQEPGRAEAWINLATSLGRSGKAKEAAKALERAVELLPERVDLAMRLGFAAHASGDSASAVKWLSRAAERVGPRFPHNAVLGLLLVQQGRAHEAFPWLARANPTEGDFARARLELAVLQRRAGEHEAAKRSLAEALSTDPALRQQAAGRPELRGLVPP